MPSRFRPSVRPSSLPAPFTADVAKESSSCSALVISLRFFAGRFAGDITAASAGAEISACTGTGYSAAADGADNVGTGLSSYRPVSGLYTLKYVTWDAASQAAWAVSSAACTTWPPRISYALCRSRGVSYFSPTSSASIMAARNSSVMMPMWLWGGRITALSTAMGVPSS